MSKRTYYTDEIYAVARVIEGMTGKTVVPTNIDGEENYDFRIEGKPVSMHQDKARGVLKRDLEAVEELRKFLVEEGFMEQGDKDDRG